MMIEDSGFTDVRIGQAVDTFGGAKGEPNARKFEVFGYAFVAHKAVRCRNLVDKHEPATGS